MRRPAAVAAFCLLVGATLAAPATAVAADDAPRHERGRDDRRRTARTSASCPRQTTIAAGGTVTWVDKSSTPHNITRCRPADCNGSDGGTGTDPTFTAARLAIPADGSAAFTFAQPGTYVYYCAIHGYGLMHGTITVTAAPATTTVPVTAAPAADRAGDHRGRTSGARPHGGQSRPNGCARDRAVAPRARGDEPAVAAARAVVAAAAPR